MTPSSSQSKVSQLCTINLGRIQRMSAWFDYSPPTKDDIEYIYELLDEIREAADKECEMKVTSD